MRRISIVSFFAIVASSLSGCGKPAPKPADSDIAAYIAQSQPHYLRVGQVRTAFEAPPAASKLPDGSWRVRVDFALRAQQDLFAPLQDSRARRTDFDLSVAKVEQFRVARIAGVEQLARQVGLMPEGARAPEPAVSVRLATAKDQARPDAVTLIAEPDGQGWKFFQADAQALDDETVGAPMDVLRADSPHTSFVTEGSPEEREFRKREQRFLEVLARAPKL